MTLKKIAKTYGRDRCRGVLAAALTAAALAAAASGAYAETPVGVEAQGIDAWTALHNPARLDLRDAQGRPVSSALIAAQLKKASVEAAAQAAATSALKKARDVARILEMLAAIAASWAWPTSAPLPQGVSVLAPGRRAGERNPRLRTVPAAFAPICGSRSAGPSDFSLDPPVLFCAPTILRC